MDQRVFIAHLNIENYRRKLHGDLDDALRRSIERLLAEEERKLSSLRASIGEDILSRLLHLFGSWASGPPGETDTLFSHPGADGLASVFDQMPCAVSLIDGSGKVVLANDAMRQLVPDEIPSRDPNRMRRWRLYGPDGAPLNPMLWPGARALRGESVVPGLAAVHTGDDDLETAFRVAAVPVTGRGGMVLGAVGAAYEASALERPDVHDLLERILVDEQLRSRRLDRGGDAV